MNQKPGAAFRDQVEETFKTVKDWDKAWQQTARSHPALHQAMMNGGKTRQQVEMANERSGDIPGAGARLLSIARDLMFHNNQITPRDAIRQACSINLPLVKAAGLTTDAAITQFANDNTAPAGARQPGQPGDKLSPTANQNENGVMQADAVALGLPNDATQAEFAAAQGAGSKELARIYTSMLGFVMRSKGLTREQAALFCMGRYPRLHQADVANQ